MRNKKCNKRRTTQGGGVAVPVAGKVLNEVIQYLGIEPTEESEKKILIQFFKFIDINNCKDLTLHITCVIMELLTRIPRIIGGFYMLNVNGGLSNVDRITFYDSEIGATAIRLPDGKIDIKYEKKNVTMESVFGLIVFCSIISLLKALIIIPYIKNHITMIWMYFIPSAFYVIFLVACIKYVREHGKKLLKNQRSKN